MSSIFSSHQCCNEEVHSGKQTCKLHGISWAHLKFRTISPLSSNVSGTFFLQCPELLQFPSASRKGKRQPSRSWKLRRSLASSWISLARSCLIVSMWNPTSSTQLWWLNPGSVTKEMLCRSSTAGWMLGLVIALPWCLIPIARHPFLRPWDKY